MAPLESTLPLTQASSTLHVGHGGQMVGHSFIIELVGAGCTSTFMLAAAGAAAGVRLACLCTPQPRHDKTERMHTAPRMPGHQSLFCVLSPPEASEGQVALGDPVAPRHDGGEYGGGAAGAVAHGVLKHTVGAPAGRTRETHRPPGLARAEVWSTLPWAAGTARQLRLADSAPVAGPTPAVVGP